MDFNTILIDWYSNNKRDFPWRKTNDPYFIWLSEIIMQQTQTGQGLPYYEAFVSNFPTVKSLAEADESEVLKLWQGLGYYSRARNLHFSAKLIAEKLDGTFPNTFDDIIKLKGVGDYTASAIASICFDEPTAVVDGNVYRVLSRYFGIDTPINSTKGIKEFKSLATDLIDHNNPGDYNQAVMEFGATVCKPQKPLCAECPLCNGCIARKENRISELPVKLKKTKVKTVYFNYLVFISSTKETLFEQRKGKGIWRNLYQFPLVISSKQLSPKEFQKNEEVQSILKDTPFEYSQYNEHPITHKLSHRTLITTFWIIEVDQLPQSGIAIKDLPTFPAPVLIGNFLEAFDFGV